MRHYDITMVSDLRCARALRHHMRETGEPGSVVFPKNGELYVALDEYSFYTVELSRVMDPALFTGIDLTEQTIAWPGDVLDWKKLPNGYVVWADGGRYKKIGGMWCRLQSRCYVSIGESAARRFLPKAWFK